jgi:hypothetical protein
VSVHLLVQEREEGAVGSDDRELQDLTVASVGGGGLATRWEPLAAFFLNAAIDHQEIPAVKKPDAIKEAAR